ncbi:MULTISPECIES: plasmid mobilization relaxosome protein MobC [unclassified Acinetobacter]|jgi:hypothetical protein|uniref:plasmid mobilization relaxosome protein MobC n=1 Tax=Acinetobacter TaxID=469 RepID=UPI0028818F11|nr:MULTISPECIES: plasmid mobilization relaxosome protein MobC [unclassified Acinetobacter]MDT0200106.1 plasmid mobilization relaxosome protein MobC [Acinetobacter sp. RG5]MDT0231540.1 plasmid mobilization relaxosome protein MobC [Acinetobacter sp. RRD8]
MKKPKRDIIKRLRFLPAQAVQLEWLLKKQNVIFTDFVHGLIRYEFQKNIHGVLEQQKEEEGSVNFRKRRRGEKSITRPAPAMDPLFLREVGRIGNNVNQIARSLNFLCLAQQNQIQRFSFLECVEILELIQIELHQCLDAIHPYKLSDQAYKKQKDRAIKIATDTSR